MRNLNGNAVQTAKEFKGFYKGSFSVNRELKDIVRDMYPKKSLKERMQYYIVLVEMCGSAWYGDEPYQIIHKVYTKATVYGLNKGELEFNTDYFSEATGLSRQELRTFIQKLIEKGLISAVKSGKGEMTIYRLQQYTKITANNTNDNIKCSNDNTSEDTSNHIENSNHSDNHSNNHSDNHRECSNDNTSEDTSNHSSNHSDNHSNNQHSGNKRYSGDKDSGNKSFKETIKESSAGVPSEGASPSSGVGSGEPTNCANENSNLIQKMRKENSPASGEDSRRREPSLDSLKKLSSNLRIKNVSPDELIFFCNSTILNKNLGKDEEERIRELFTQHAPENQDTTLKIFALELLSELNKDFALKIKKKFQKEFSSEITTGEKNPFTLGEALRELYKKYSEKSVEENKKKIENFYAQAEKQNFKYPGSDKAITLPIFVYWLETKYIQFRTREQEAPFKKEELRKRLPNEDERVLEMLEATYDRYFNRGNWTSKNGNKIDLNMFTSYFRDDARKKLMEQGYVPKEDKSVRSDGRKYYDPKDIPELLKKWS